jgi:hypothetical protein
LEFKAVDKISLLLFILLLTSCSLLKRKGSWGKNALYSIKGERIINALKKNLSSPHVWVPLVGAGAISWGGYDNKITHWAYSESSVFKNAKAADNWSDHFNNILKYEMYASTILTPSMDEDESLKNYAFSKAKGAVVVSFASTSSRLARNRTAKVVQRKRPNKDDLKSFPSGHATEAGSRNVLISKNIDSIDMPKDLRFGIKAVNTTISIGTLWARLEGNRHYPSDVLVGYAMGTFLSGFIFDSLMNLEPSDTFVIVPMGDKVFAQYKKHF